jgi:hypothetical protein
MPSIPSPAMPSPDTFAPASSLNEEDPDDLPF